MELLQTLGIEPKLLIAQIVNFAILLFVLWKVAYKPLLALMKERSDRIQKSLEDAEALKQEREQWAARHEQMLSTANTEVREMIVGAQQQIDAMRQDAKKKSDEELARARERHAQEFKQYEQRTLKELEQRVTGLVASVAGRFVKEKMTTTDDGRLIQEAFDSSRR